MSKHSIVRWIKIIGGYLLVAAVAALGWLWCALPEEVYLEPEQTLTLPRFGWVEPLREMCIRDSSMGTLFIKPVNMNTARPAPKPR